MSFVKSNAMEYEIYVSSGMSGVGKASIINELTKEGEYVYPIITQRVQ